MSHDDQFTEDMARELDTTIRMLDARQLFIEALMGAEHVSELCEYLIENVEHAQEVAELERWLDSRDNEWIYIVSRLKRARQQRVMLGRLCMKMDLSGR